MHKGRRRAIYQADVSPRARPGSAKLGFSARTALGSYGKTERAAGAGEILGELVPEDRQRRSAWCRDPALMRHAPPRRRLSAASRMTKYSIQQIKAEARQALPGLQASYQTSRRACRQQGQPEGT